MGERLQPFAGLGILHVEIEDEKPHYDKATSQDKVNGVTERVLCNRIAVEQELILFNALVGANRCACLTLVTIHVGIHVRKIGESSRVIQSAIYPKL